MLGQFMTVIPGYLCLGRLGQDIKC